MIAHGLAGRTALVIGASRGIGAAAAAALAARGARVMIASRDQAALDAQAQAITGAGGEAAVQVVDASDPASIANCVAGALDHFGKLDIAVNNVGISLPAKPCADIEAAEFAQILAVNLQSAFVAMRHEIAAMRGSGGAIVNTASIGGLVALRGMAAYTASKHGLIGLTKAAALDHAVDRVRVNAVAPGTVMTEMLKAGVAATPQGEARITAAVPMGRIATADEVGGAIAWLCSDEASYMTGAVLTVDGGYTIA